MMQKLETIADFKDKYRMIVEEPVLDLIITTVSKQYHNPNPLTEFERYLQSIEDMKTLAQNYIREKRMYDRS